MRAYSIMEPERPGGANSMRTVLDEEYVTMAEAARLLQVHISTIRRWIDSGELPAHRVGQRRVIIKRADLTKLIAPARSEQEKGDRMSKAEALSVPPLTDQ